MRSSNPRAKKYVVFDDGTVIRFPQEFDHKEEADQYRPRKPVSAGMYVIENGKTRIFGRSDSLKLRPREGDERKV